MNQRQTKVLKPIARGIAKILRFSKHQLEPALITITSAATEFQPEARSSSESDNRHVSDKEKDRRESPIAEDTTPGMQQQQGSTVEVEVKLDSQIAEIPQEMQSAVAA